MSRERPKTVLFSPNLPCKCVYPVERCLCLKLWTNFCSCIRNNHLLTSSSLHTKKYMVQTTEVDGNICSTILISFSITLYFRILLLNIYLCLISYSEGFSSWTTEFALSSLSNFFRFCLHWFGKEHSSCCVCFWQILKVGEMRKGGEEFDWSRKWWCGRQEQDSGMLNYHRTGIPPSSQQTILIWFGMMVSFQIGV